MLPESARIIPKRGYRFSEMITRQQEEAAFKV
jgi:hypothetical protein